MSGFTPEQLQQITDAVRMGIREELADAGLRVDGDDHQDAAREDFRFLRRLRENYDGAAKQVGRAVLGAAITLSIAIAGAGFWTWFNRGGGP